MSTTSAQRHTQHASSTRNATYVFALEIDALARLKVESPLFDDDAILLLWQCEKIFHEAYTLAPDVLDIDSLECFKVEALPFHDVVILRLWQCAHV